jgi:hypothetical protein
MHAGGKDFGEESRRAVGSEGESASGAVRSTLEPAHFDGVRSEGMLTSILCVSNLEVANIAATSVVVTSISRSVARNRIPEVAFVVGSELRDRRR